MAAAEVYDYLVERLLNFVVRSFSCRILRYAELKIGPWSDSSRAGSEVATVIRGDPYSGKHHALSS